MQKMRARPRLAWLAVCLSKGLRVSALAAVLGTSLLSVSASATAKPVAIVIGNDRYINLPPNEQLERAQADARAVAVRLEADGFRVVLRLNATRADIVSAVNEAAGQIDPGSTTLFYFAGHGVEISGANYLIPSDAPTPSQADAATLTGRSVALSFVQSSLGGHGAKANIVVLDACRANPYEVVVRGPGGGNRGLARVSAPTDGYFMIYSAGFGQTALDRLPQGDADQNSVFTRVLLRYLARTDLSLVAIAKGLQRDVSALASQADHPQTPAYYDQLNGDFTILGQSLGVDATHAPPSFEAAASPLPVPLYSPSSRVDPSTLLVAATGSQASHLRDIIGPISGIRFTDVAHADLAIDADNGALTNAQGQTLFMFGRSQSSVLYVGVLAKWLLAKSVSSRSNRSVDAALMPVRSRYNEGDDVVIAISANDPGYVVAFDMAADGSISLLEPDPARPSSRLARTDPSGRFQVPIKVSPPVGMDHMFVAVTPREPSDLATLLRRLHGRAPSRSELNELQSMFTEYSHYLSMVEFYTDGRPSG